MRIVHVVGARPNFMKIAPIMEAIDAHTVAEQVLVHTGQHYDPQMSKVFFDDLGLPEPDINLGVGSAGHAQQTAQIMVALDRELERLRPDLVVVVGDVNSTLAASLVAAKRQIRCAHVEAGLRSGDRAMPEEINRIVTDRLCDLLFTHSPDADDNLLKEGAPPDSIFRVGNVMIDTLKKHLPAAKSRPILQELAVVSGGYALVTLHRPSNVDERMTLQSVLKALKELTQHTAVVFAVHPRCRARLEAFELWNDLQSVDQLTLVPPLGYLDFLCLTANAKVVLTDSGGLQEETTALGVPCLTMRRNTERPITINLGTNTLVGTDAAKIVESARAVLEGQGKQGAVPELWDGLAGKRTADVLVANAR